LNETEASAVDNAAAALDEDNDAEMEDAAAVVTSGASGNVNRPTTKSSSAYTLHAHKVFKLGVVAAQR
jgi:hypothetical protein